jgi:16S rRNA (guanine(527)-N(7))-methyltransferase RsmG
LSARADQPVHEDVRPTIRELATRFGLAEGASDALEGLVRLVDWAEPNFVPKVPPQPRNRDRRRPPERWSQTASRLLVESLSGLELEPVRKARRLADVGSGAGFPGLVLGIALPRADVFLIEKVPDKCKFLRSTVAELGVDNVEVVEGPVQRWSEGMGACDVVTSRKVGRLNTIMDWCAPLVAPQGALVLWQARRDPAKESLGAEAAGAAGLRFARTYPWAANEASGQLYLYERVGEA